MKLYGLPMDFHQNCQSVTCALGSRTLAFFLSCLIDDPLHFINTIVARFIALKSSEILLEKKSDSDDKNKWQCTAAAHKANALAGNLASWWIFWWFHNDKQMFQGSWVPSSLQNYLLTGKKTISDGIPWNSCTYCISRFSKDPKIILKLQVDTWWLIIKIIPLSDHQLLSNNFKVCLPISLQ